MAQSDHPIPCEYLYHILAEEDSVICTTLFAEWEGTTHIIHHKFEELAAVRDNREKFDHLKLVYLLVCTSVCER